MSPSSPPASKAGISVDGRVAAYGTDQLWTMLPTDGTWRGVIPQNPGDYAYSNKLPWGGTFSFKDGPLTVTGKRLDGPAPSFTEIEPISWEHAFMGFVNIPLFGCWEITGEYRDQELRFVVWVTAFPEQTIAPTSAPQPAAHSSAVRTLRVDSEAEAESLVYRVMPEIPHEAKVANVSGTVVLHGVIGIDGRPHHLQYVSGPRVLTQAAIDAVTWWQYRIDQENVEVDTTIAVVFQARDN